VGFRLVGPPATFLGLVAISPGLSHKSAEFTSEPLLLLLVTLTFYTLVKGFDRPWLWLLAGVYGGLAYLTKGSALLLLVAYAISVLRVSPKLILNPRFLLFPVAYFAVASPLLLYNWQVFGSPFFNYNSTHIIWLDSTAEQAFMFEKGLPTMSSYLATHTIGEIAWRFLKGLVMVRGIEWVWPFLCIFLIVPKRWLTYFSAFPEKRRLIAVATTLVLTFYLPFAWDAVVQRGIRFLLPLFPIIFLLLADVIVFYGARLATWLWPPSTRERLAPWAMAGILAVLGVTWLAQFGIQTFKAPLAIDFEDQATAEVYHLLDTAEFGGKKVLFGPSHQFTGAWLFRHPVAFAGIPPALPASGFLPWLSQQGIDYILANRHMLQRKADTIQEYFVYDASEGVKIVRLEPGWEVVYRAPRPSKFVLVRVR